MLGASTLVGIAMLRYITRRCRRDDPVARRGGQAGYAHRDALPHRRRRGTRAARPISREFPCIAPERRSRSGWPRPEWRADAPSNPWFGAAHHRGGRPTHRGGEDRNSDRGRRNGNNHTTPIRHPVAPEPFGADRQTRCGTMNNTFGLATVSASAARPARAGVSLPRLCIHLEGMCDLLAVDQQRWIQNTISAAPTAMRTHDAQGGGVVGSTTRFDISRKMTVNAVRPAASRPGRQAGRPGPRRTQREHRRDDGQRRQRDDQRQGMSSVSTGQTICTDR